MSDLQTRIRDYYDTAARPVKAAEILADATGADPVQTWPRSRWRPIGAFVVAATAVLLLAVPLILLRTTPGTPDSAGPKVEGIWSRTLFEPRFVTEDLISTSFGLVAAAGQDGVWLSADGDAWRQVLDLPYEPPASEDEPSPLGNDIETVVEFDGALYAIGKTWRDLDDGYESRTVVWRSEDGWQWNESNIDDFPQVIEAVANDDQILVVGRFVDGDRPQIGTVIFRTSNGRDWTQVEATGLRGVVWAISTFEDHFVAISAVGDSGYVFRSLDGVDWTEMGPWSVTPPGEALPLDPSYSVWPLIDLFEITDRLVAVGVTGARVEGSPPKDGLRPTVIITTSTDGVTFEILDNPLILEDGRMCTLELEDRRRECPGSPPVQPPEGAAIDDRIVFLGHSYPTESDDPVTYRWVGRLSG